MIRMIAGVQVGVSSPRVPRLSDGSVRFVLPPSGAWVVR